MSYLVHILSDINFQELKRYVFIVFLKQFVVIAHLSSFGKLFHRIAAPVSIRRLPYRTDLYLFGVIDVVLGMLLLLTFSEFVLYNSTYRHSYLKCSNYT